MSNDSVRGGAEISPGIFLPRSALKFTFSRSSGPGGQHINKVATRVQLRLALEDLEQQLGAAAISRLKRMAGPSRVTSAGELLLVAAATRSQHVNRRMCLQHLSDLIVEARKPPPRRMPTAPSKTVRQRRIDQKKHRGRIKQTRQSPDIEL